MRFPGWWAPAGPAAKGARLPRGDLKRMKFPERERDGRVLSVGDLARAVDPTLPLSIKPILYAGIDYGILSIMETARKITVEVPMELLEKAQRAAGTGITQTVRTGLQLVAASQAYARLRQLRGKVRFSRALAELKADR
jgi:hypothetical protein